MNKYLLIVLLLSSLPTWAFVNEIEGTFNDKNSIAFEDQGFDHGSFIENPQGNKGRDLAGKKIDLNFQEKDFALGTFE